MRNRSQMERNRAIALALDSGTRPGALSEQYGISYSHIYRAAAAGRAALAGNGASAEGFAAVPSLSLAGGALFKELASSGLRRFGGRIDDDYDRVFRTFSRRMALYREMGDDPIVAAVLQAVRMTLRRVSWSVEPGGEAVADEAAAGFLETAMQDMSQSWSDVIDQALGMIQYGFQLAEIVYKRRRGPAAKAGSAYDDGRIGWRKWIFIAPESLSPGDEWIFDEHGGLQGFQQSAPPDFKLVTVPIEKAILFRTTAEKNNPEGKSLLRAMYPAWYMARNLMEIEAIAAERMGAGFPVIYAGYDVGKDDSANSDLGVLKDIVRNVRVDEQMGLVLPFPKMGSGAPEGRGVLFELVSPPGRGGVNFHETISRYEQRMAMVGLAQFIHLGMSKIGTQALARTTTDFFTLAVAAWLDSIEDTIARFAVERLFRLNSFPGLTAYPQLRHEVVGQRSLEDLSDYISKLAGAGMIVPEPELEQHLRALADLPGRSIEVAPEKPEVGEAGEASETFADTRDAGRAEGVAAANAYQHELEQTYSGWADDLAGRLAAANADEQDDIIDEAVVALVLLLVGLGRQRIPEATYLGLGDVPPTPETLRRQAGAVERNDEFIGGSLGPDVAAKARQALEPGAGMLLRDALETMIGRVAMYAGAWWAEYNLALGDAAQGGPVNWALDPNAKHCPDCPVFAGRYTSMDALLARTGGATPGIGVQCDGNCRCILETA